MPLPPISPTGALASGDYVDYMISYNTAAEASLATDLGHYVTQSTLTDWDNLWVRILDDTAFNVTTLEIAVNKLKAQVGMIKDAIGKL